MLYELDNAEKCGYYPPCLRSVQNLAPFKDFLTQDHLPFLPKRPEHHVTLREDENHPPWPNLIGCVPLFLQDTVSLHHLFEDGSIYSIKYSKDASSVGKEKEPYIDLDFINQQESILFKEYTEISDLFQNSQVLKLKSSRSSVKKGTRVFLNLDKSPSISYSDPPTTMPTDSLSSVQEYYLERWMRYEDFYQSKDLSFKSLSERKRNIVESSSPILPLESPKTHAVNESVPAIVQYLGSQDSPIRVESKKPENAGKSKNMEKSKRRKGF